MLHKTILFSVFFHSSFQMSVEMFDYMDDILNLQRAGRYGNKFFTYNRAFFFATVDLLTSLRLTRKKYFLLSFFFFARFARIPVFNEFFYSSQS